MEKYSVENIVSYLKDKTSKLVYKELNLHLEVIDEITTKSWKTYLKTLNTSKNLSKTYLLHSIKKTNKRYYRKN